jgi:acetyl esterase
MLSRLDPELAAVLARFPQGFDPGEHLADMDVVRMLRSTPDLMAGTGASLPTDDRVGVENRMIDGPAGPGALGVRVYTPNSAPSPMPAVVFCHGGAFILGDTYSEEHRCLRYAAEAGCVVVSVEWRHAPELPFPAGVEDAYAALGWTVARADELGVDATRVAVAGVSSGGAFAAASALMARDRGGPAPVLQLLVYPVVDDRLESASMRDFDATPLWTRMSSALMWEHYLGPARTGEPSPYAAPARATDLSGLPPAYVMVAELDPLRDEAIDYARRLLEAGVPTELHCFPGTCHGFDVVAPDTAVGRSALDEQVRALRRAFAATPS